MATPPPTAKVIHLGFCEPISSSTDSDNNDIDININNMEHIGHRSPNWNNWDGGQVGGIPSWLNPKDLPQGPLTCRAQGCDLPLVFICQLYAPGEQDYAFHRSLYVFACTKCDTTEGSIRVLRGQLPRENPYYAPTITTTTSNATVPLQSPLVHQVVPCAVCGQRGKGKCPKQGEYFCGPLHQREYKLHFGKQAWLPSVFTMYELVVEDEDDEPLQLNEQDNQSNDRQALFTTTDDSNDDDDDEDLEQDDLNAMTGARETIKEDGMTTDFYMRIQNAKDQCLRYSKWQDNAEIWIRSDFRPMHIPKCACGAPRKFECQIMPQMLHYLLQGRTRTIVQKELSLDVFKAAASIVEQQDPSVVPPLLKQQHDEQLIKIQTNLLKTELDWGTICIYTCTQSCDTADLDGDLGAYQEEYAWRQPAL